MKKKLFISLMVIVLTVILIPFNTEEVNANSESANFTGALAQATLMRRQRLIMSKANISI